MAASIFALIYLSLETLPSVCSSTGLYLVRYDDEVGFTSTVSSEYVSSLNMDSTKYLYDAFKATGSFCPQKSGIYKFKMDGRPVIQMKFQGDSYPSSLGTAGQCWPNLNKEQISNSYTLYTNRCYSITLLLRTGCSLYSSYMKLQVSFNGSDYYVPSDFVGCTYDDCYPNYYGSTCSNYATANCSSHGTVSTGVSGTGECICDDGYDKPNCTTASATVETNCNSSVQMNVYSNEIAFSSVQSTATIPNATLDSIDYTYKSIIIAGSIHPPYDGEYQFRIKAKPYGQFTFGGSSYPSSIGPAGACWPTITTDETSDVFTLNASMTYAFTIKYRSGCGLYSKYIDLYWKNGPKYGSIDLASWESIPSMYFYSCTTDDCISGLYGSSCQYTCPTCPTHAQCFDGREGNGSCYCLDGYYGSSCQYSCSSNDDCGGSSQGTCFNQTCYCEENYFGDHCATYCNRNSTCNSRGECTESGSCSCDSGYSGSSCSEISTSESNSTCNTGATYTRYENEISFSSTKSTSVVSPIDLSFEGMTYDSAKVIGSVKVVTTADYIFRIKAHPYAQLSIGGNVVPSSIGLAGSCLGSISTDKTTSTITMYANKYYPFTISYRSGCGLYTHDLKLLWKRSDWTDYQTVPADNLFTCTDVSCGDLYAGDNCDQYCSTDCGSHGTCAYSGNSTYCSCDDNYYGTACSIHCVDNSTCGSNGVCGSSGSCECNSGYTGTDCSESESSSLAGNSLSCSHSVTEIIHSNEFFGSTSSTATLTSISLDIATSTTYKSITITGSISPTASGYYRFKADGKPTVKLTINNYSVSNPSVFTAGRCDTGSQSAESGAIYMYLHRLYPFSLYYRSGCGLYSKYLRLYYQKGDSTGSFDDSTWISIPSTMLRSCTTSECELGYYGTDCSSLCSDCGTHGVCSDGVEGTGTCECDEWYYGTTCSYNEMTIIIGSVGLLFGVSMIWVCWPGKLEEVESDDEESEPKKSSKKPANYNNKSMINKPLTEGEYGQRSIFNI